uniref:Fanconi anemia group I protein n=1 Tax=Angiostrongylus cantonensis TaxID=6313 RepID=A0A0K0DDM8_ANGCA
MKPPPSKKARNATRSTDVSIEQIVEQAVLSDDAACESLLRRLTGFEKEVVDAVVVISKGVNTMRRHPYMAALSMLLDSSHSDISDRIIELITLQELPTHEKNEAADLIVSFLPSYCSRCSNKQLQIFLEFVISKRSEEETVRFERYSEAFNESVRNYFGHGIKTKWKIDEVFSSNEESLLNAFLSIPVQSLSAFASEQYAEVVKRGFRSKQSLALEKGKLFKETLENLTDLEHYLCPALTFFKGSGSTWCSWTQIIRLTSSIIAGEFNFDKIVIDRALTFQLKYLPFVYERARNLENIIDWKVLLYLQRVGISLDVPISILSTERVLELLATCPSELEIKNEMLSIVAKLISPRLKSVATTCLVSLASIFERAKNCIEILSCAASALEINFNSQLFGHTDVERDIVVLCLGIASSQPLNDAVYNRIRGMQKVIQNAMLYAHHASKEKSEAMWLVIAITNVQVVGPILSQIIKHSGKTELTVWKLSTISDKHRCRLTSLCLPSFLLFFS